MTNNVFTRKIILCFLAAFLILTSCKDKARTESPDIEPELSDLRKQIRKHPRDASLYMSLSDYFVKKRILDSALNNALKAIRLDSNNSEFYVKLSDLYFTTEEMDLCEDMLNKSICLDGKNKEAYLKLAELHFLFKRYEESMEAINKVLEINSYNPKAYFIKGWINREQGDTALAIRSYMTAVDQNSQYFEAYEELAHLYHLKHNPLAIEHYKNALKIKPNDTQNIYNLGMFYQEMEDYKKALLQYERILEIDPSNKYAMHNMGWIYLNHLAKYDEAISCFTKALEQDTSFLEAVFNRGLSFEHQGNYRSARQDYSYVLHLDPNYTPAIESLNRLDAEQK